MSELDNSLISACEDGEEVCLLLEEGANINTVRDYESPLTLAAENGYLEIVSLLLEKGAILEMNDLDQTPLIAACEYGRKEVVSLLLEKGSHLGKENWLGLTPLMAAITSGRIDVVSLLLNHGADIHQRNKDGDVSFMIACRENRHTDICLLLLEKGADREAKNYRGQTSWMFASRKGQIAPLSLLLEKGVDFEAKDKDGFNSLILASRYGKTEVVSLLLEKGADIEAKDIEGYTPLMIASLCHHPNVVSVLLEKGANFEAKNENGETALMLATHGNIPKRFTPVHSDMTRSSDRQLLVLSLLLENGADPEPSNLHLTEHMTKNSWRNYMSARIEIELLFSKYLRWKQRRNILILQSQFTLTHSQSLSQSISPSSGSSCSFQSRSECLLSMKTVNQSGRIEKRDCQFLVIFGFNPLMLPILLSVHHSIGVLSFFNLSRHSTHLMTELIVLTCRLLVSSAIDYFINSCLLAARLSPG